jgi:hypothetical protein
MLYVPCNAHTFASRAHQGQTRLPVLPQYGLSIPNMAYLDQIGTSGQSDGDSKLITLPNLKLSKICLVDLFLLSNRAFLQEG